MKTALKEAIDAYPVYSSMEQSTKSDNIEYFALPNPDKKRKDFGDPNRLPFSLKRRRSRDKWTLVITIIALLATILFLLIAFLVVARSIRVVDTKFSSQCNEECVIKLAETLPDDIYGGIRNFGSIKDAWHTLLDNAKISVDIASSYWSLLDADVAGGPYFKYSKVGEAIYKKLETLATKKGVRIRIVQQVPTSLFPQKDTAQLSKLKNIEVRSLNFSQLQNGSSGILHTKMWIVDGRHIYLGSANMDWRSLTQVKEVGVLSYNCSCIGADMNKIFAAYWVMAKKEAKVPHVWPSHYDTHYNKGNPMRFMDSNGRKAKVFVGSSPPILCPKNRTQDIDALLYVIKNAKQFIYISVMDYIPVIMYGSPKRYWGVIDDALKRAAYDRGIDIRLLASKWKYTSLEQQFFLKSLKDINFAAAAHNGSVQVKNFVLPPNSIDIPFTRVNHDKYMVTDNLAYIGTSNWVGDYFTDTGGVSYTIAQASVSTKLNLFGKSDDIRAGLKKIFERDWNSKYAQDI